MRISAGEHGLVSIVYLVAGQSFNNGTNRVERKHATVHGVIWWKSQG